MSVYLGFIVEEYSERGGIGDLVYSGRRLARVRTRIEEAATLMKYPPVEARIITVAEQAENIRSGRSTSSHFRVDVPLEDTLKPIEIKAQPARLELVDSYYIVRARNRLAASHLAVVDLGDWSYRFEWGEFFDPLSSEETY